MSVVRDAFACKPAVVAETPATSPWPRSTGPWPSCLASPTPSSSSPNPRRSTRGAAEHVDDPDDCDDARRPGAVNPALRAPCPKEPPPRSSAPRGRHNLAVGLTARRRVTVEGNAGYFLGGLCGTRDGTGPDIVVNGFVGWSVGENLMGGTIRVQGSASQSAGASARAGASSSRATPRCAPGSRSRAPRWPSPATPAP